MERPVRAVRRENEKTGRKPREKDERRGIVLSPACYPTERTGSRSGTIVPSRQTAESSACSAGSSLSFRRAKVITRIALPANFSGRVSHVHNPLPSIFLHRHGVPSHTCMQPIPIASRYPLAQSHARIYAAHAPRELFASTFPPCLHLVFAM